MKISQSAFKLIALLSLTVFPFVACTTTSDEKTFEDDFSYEPLGTEESEEYATQLPLDEDAEQNVEDYSLEIAEENPDADSNLSLAKPDDIEGIDNSESEFAQNDESEKIDSELLADNLDSLPESASDIEGPRITSTPSTVSSSAQLPATPVSSGSQYTVKKGDTLTAISKRQYGKSKYFRAVARANGIKNPNLIYAGQTIELPSMSSIMNQLVSK